MVELSPSARDILEVLAREPGLWWGYGEVQNATGLSIQSTLQGLQELEGKRMLERDTRDGVDWPNPRQMHRITVDGLNYLRS